MATITGHFEFVFEKIPEHENHLIIVTTSFPKISVFKCFPSIRKRKPAFSNSRGLNSVFEKLCFGDGLVWTVGLTVEIKLRVFKFFHRPHDAA